jgi:hypothetical protein
MYVGYYVCNIFHCHINCSLHDHELFFKKYEDFVAYSFSIDASIDVTVIVQFPVSIPGVVEGSTAGSYGGKQAVMSSSEMLTCYSKYNLLGEGSDVFK